MKRIFLHPGYIRSRVDSDEHYISPIQLAFLYNVNFVKCIVVREGNTSFKDKRYPIGMSHLENDVHLYPRYDGKYEAV